MIRAYKGKLPRISNSAYIADTAVIIGDVTLGENVSVWDGAVLRGDEGAIIVGANSNVQENCTVHTEIGKEVIIGKNVTIGHNAVIHGCRIGDDSLIGMGAIVLNGADVGEECIIGAGSLVTQNKLVPRRSLCVGSPFIVKREVLDTEAEANRANAELYVKLASEYKIR